MRFFQIHTFYPEYLASWYARNPGLSERPYVDQLESLLSDGFSYSHLFGAQLRDFGVDSHVTVANCAPLQHAWAREHGVAVDEKHWLYQIALAQAEHYKPDILYLSDPIVFDSSFVRRLSKRPPFIAGWRAAGIPPWSDFTEFNLMLSSDPVSSELALKHGAQATQHFLPGFPEWVAEAVKDQSKQYDLVFCGQLSHEHMRRVELIESLSYCAATTGLFKPAFFLYKANDWRLQYAPQYTHREQWGLDLFKSLRRGKIGFNNVIDFAKGEAGNMRQFEVTGSGSFLLTEANENLAKHFEPGTEVETYSSFDELIEKIHYYSTHDAEREAIARRGQERCLREHGMIPRTQQLVEILQSHVGSIDLRMATAQIPSAIDLLREAAQYLESNAVAEGYRSALRALKHYPHARNVNYVLGVGLLKLQRPLEAHAALVREVSLFPDNPEASSLLRELRSAVPGDLLQRNEAHRRI
jgi:hypothetical protein